MTIRGIAPDEVEIVAALHERQNERPANRSYIERCIAEFPSAISFHRGEVSGFAYCTRFAPDLLELTNILVTTAHRGRGVGSLLLRHLEAQSARDWAGIVLSNSALWNAPTRQSPLPFYSKNGFQVIWETRHTTVMAKSLEA